ncbi:hypothetical protein TW044 [Tropheryma whipplei TW08/27]|nr:hypothetical protein TW044 [Tropheryma whipplei TW08/27]
MKGNHVMHAPGNAVKTFDPEGCLYGASSGAVGGFDLV